MSPSATTLSPETRHCPFCGKPIPVRLTRCPFCREEIQEVRIVGRRYHREALGKMRRGLFYILLAAAIHYFAAGYSSFPLPITIPSFVTMYLTPLLFLAGVGFELYGVFLYLKS